MLNLDTKLTLTEAAIKSPNLCSRFSEKDLTAIGNWCYLGYQRDEQSRRRWKTRNTAGMDLALQVQKTKSFPWPDASNIAFPLVTIAAMQFHSRAYTAIVSGTDVVRCRVVGEDPDGKERARADRVSTHMSWQCLEQDDSWEEQHDRLLINLPIVGTAFKKSYYDASLGYNTSELVLAQDLVLDYYAKSVERCPRKTHIIPFFRNEIHERVLRGTFRNILNDPWYQEPATQNTERNQDKDNRQGVTPPTGDETTPFICLEQHCDLDLDGDGYAEPYVITLEESSQTVLRIVCRFTVDDIDRLSNGSDKGKIVRVRSWEYFTKYPFIPSPDGGIYDIGFGILLGPINESVNTSINQLTDAGTMANTAGGFLGRGAKMRGGVYQFSPFGWNRVDSTGDDLRKSIFPLPVREPSAVLFQLLGLLIEYSNRITGNVDAMMGVNPGQNTPAGTQQSMIEQGQIIYSTIFKRIWRSMKKEFQKLFQLNAMYLPTKFHFGGEGAFVLREDYLGTTTGIAPAADPHVTSDTIKYQQAVMVKQAAMTSQGYNLEAVERRFLKAIHVDGVSEIYPGPGKVPPLPNPKVQVEQMKMEQAKAELEFQKQSFLLSLMEERKLNEAKIIDLTAKAQAAMAGVATDQINADTAAFNAQVSALKLHSEHLNKQIELMMKQMEIEKKPEASSGNQGSIAAK